MAATKPDVWGGVPSQDIVDDLVLVGKVTQPDGTTYFIFVEQKYVGYSDVRSHGGDVSKLYDDAKLYFSTSPDAGAGQWQTLDYEKPLPSGSLWTPIVEPRGSDQTGLELGSDGVISVDPEHLWEAANAFAKFEGLLGEALGKVGPGSQSMTFNAGNFPAATAFEKKVQNFVLGLNGSLTELKRLCGQMAKVLGLLAAEYESADADLAAYIGEDGFQQALGGLFPPNSVWDDTGSGEGAADDSGDEGSGTGEGETEDEPT